MGINFLAYKTNIIKTLFSKGIINSRTFQEFSSAKNLGNLRNGLEHFLEIETKQKPMDEFVRLGLDAMSKKGKTTLETEQALYRFTQELTNKYANIARITSRVDEKEAVLKIKQQLKDEFGIEACLDNSVNFAKQCLKSMKILKSNGYTLPKQIIGSSMIQGCYSGYEKSIPTIIINTKMGPSWTCSTESPLHYIIHETTHLNQPNLFAFNLKKIPNKLRQIADDVSIYASGNYAQEIDAELKTKKLLEGLSQKEKELEKFLNS